MAASIHLARAGMRVTCIETDPQDVDPVGESLDWSAPELLRELDLPMDRLLRDGIATYKRHVILKLISGAARHYFRLIGSAAHPSMSNCGPSMWIVPVSIASFGIAW